MTSQEFIMWLKGFTEGVHEYNVTPKQWDLLKERLAEVEDDEESVETESPQPSYPRGFPIGPYGTGTPNHDLVQRYPWGGQVVWAGTTIPCSGTLSTVSVNSGKPNPITYTITSASAYSGPATYTYPNGTTVSYTTGTDENWNIKNKDLLHD